MSIVRRHVLSSICALLACASLWPVATSAHEYEVGKILVEHPWLRAPQAGESAAKLFMVVKNRGGEPDRLIGVKSADVGSFELHAAPHFIVATDAIYLPPGATATLAPGGSYVQLLDIKKINPVGWGFEVTLVFAKAGPVTIDASIDAPDARHAHDAEALERWEKAQARPASTPSEPEAPPPMEHHHDHMEHHDQMDHGDAEQRPDASAPQAE
jgi:hypothetical protein